MAPITKIDQNTFGPWAIVTGASSGIGKEFARQLAASGLNLVLVARRLNLLDELGTALAQQHGIQFRTVGVDLTAENFMVPLQAVTHDLDIGLVISNAGTGNPGEFLAHNLTDLHQIVRLNVLSHMQLAHFYGQQLMERGQGGMVLVSAMGASQGIPLMANDSATKAYIISLGEALHVEWEKAGVHVTVVLPGPTDTPIIDKFGIDIDSMPMKPMSVEQCVAEGLAALKNNRSSILTGRTNRIMARLVPDTLSRRINGKMIARSLANRPSTTA